MQFAICCSRHKSFSALFVIVSALIDFRAETMAQINTTAHTGLKAYITCILSKLLVTIPTLTITVSIFAAAFSE